ncbi:MAG: glycosyltransferase family 2 protein [Rhodobacteraceae bacterium]|nr:glycosyltransferase family 2 protein [Paracoccaceae bacterium]
MIAHCLLSAVKNEGPDLLEWLCWHRMIGFDRIVIFSNDCTDGSDGLLDALQGIGWLTHHRHNPPSGVAPQTWAGNLAFTCPEVRKAGWVMWLDADEFLLVHSPAARVQDLTALLNERQAAGMAVSWRIFGDSGHDLSPPGLVTQNFTRAAGPAYQQHRTVKTLFRMDERIESLYIHRPVWKPNQKVPPVLLLNGGGAPLPLAFTHGRSRNGEPEYELPEGLAAHDLAQVNHYATKALDRVALKRQRGDGMRADGANARLGQVYLNRYNRNEREDGRMLRHLPALRNMMDAALSHPPVAEAMATCRSLFNARLSSMADAARLLADDRQGLARRMARQAARAAG